MHFHLQRSGVWFTSILLIQLAAGHVHAQPFPTSADLVPDCGKDQRMAGTPESRAACDRLERHLKWLETRLKAVCVDSGERIVRTVNDVEGVYVKPPAGERFGRFHEEDRMASSWMSPTRFRHYTLWEMDAFDKPGVVWQKRYLIAPPQGPQRSKINEPSTQLGKPSARYGVTWRTFGEPADLARGLQGDETVVYDVAGGEILGTRRFYAAFVGPQSAGEGGVSLHHHEWGRRFQERVFYCPNYRPREDVGFIDGRPRDAYEFVARVARPPVMADATAVGVFDLAHGSGVREGGCMSASFGPRIGPEDLNVVRIDDHGIRLSVKGTGDALKCPKFFAPGYHAKAARYRFYDGSSWGPAEIERRASLSPRTLTPVGPPPPEPGGKVDLSFNRMSRPPAARDLVADCVDAVAGSPARSDCERLDRHVQRQEAKLAALCRDAGEKISRIVPDVPGFLVKFPPQGTADDTFHAERGALAYLQPFSGRLYSHVEIDSGAPAPQPIERIEQVLTPNGRERPSVLQSSVRLDKARSRHGLTWRSIANPADRPTGLFGDETTVYDIASGEVLATRRIYYYVLRAGLVDESGQALVSGHWRQKTLPDFAQTCRNFTLREDGRTSDLRPRDSYDFVSRVLRPAPFSPSVAIGIFDLARGKGPHHGSCTFARFGPGIVPDDLEVTYVEVNSIKISIKGTRDALWCGNYYGDSSRAYVHRTELVFFDGTRWGFEDIDRRSGLRDRVLKR